jgi:hypothetical protein
VGSGIFGNDNAKTMAELLFGGIVSRIGKLRFSDFKFREILSSPKTFTGVSCTVLWPAGTTGF